MAHPHVRGEHIRALNSGNCHAGSSPRAWGTRADCKNRLGVGRFIPTCVGNTYRLVRKTPAGAVHPHVRGEHAPYNWQPGEKDGSSPRAWGTQAGFMPASALHRFIPTCVGNTPSMARRRTSCSGSSPRAWGTHTERDRPSANQRFIPTCVGNTALHLHTHPNTTVHPTCVGNTASSLMRRDRWSVHPHVRGEHNGPCPSPSGSSGSSHVRGEHANSPVESRPFDGSSPRAWGTHHFQAADF
ncbi:Domain of uncharacterised function (DUF2825) [Chromobacterium violaceum]|uniref:Domain of uncharacterized function (DUF2825) n=1 Tax=Chromobacterium violaceum TaxID=536 RepID=A0A3S4IE69_CHRVL|nr:Domain of uncharacterised function (DUF2825) [Chromobacterium violaceum]